MAGSPRPHCAACGVVIRRRLKVPYCPDCRHSHCTDCGAALPRANVKRRCGACQREASERMFRQPNRRCCLCSCALPQGHRHTRCHACLREEHRWYREWLARRKDPHCEDCGLSIRGRSSVRCAECAHRYKIALPRRLCPTCRHGYARPGKSYCRPCDVMYQRWRYAYAKGDPGAHALKTKHTYQTQKKELAP